MLRLRNGEPRDQSRAVAQRRAVRETGQARAIIDRYLKLQVQYLQQGRSVAATVELLDAGIAELLNAGRQPSKSSSQRIADFARTMREKTTDAIQIVEEHITLETSRLRPFWQESQSDHDRNEWFAEEDSEEFERLNREAGEAVEPTWIEEEINRDFERYLRVSSEYATTLAPSMLRQSPSRAREQATRINNNNNVWRRNNR